MNSRPPLPGHADDRLELAGEWHARLHDAPGDAVLRAAFDEWLRRDLRNRLAYAEVCAAAFALEQAGATVPAHAARAARPRRAAWLGLAASLVLVFFAWQGTRPLDALRSDHRTAEGEVREIALPDGSRAWLAGDSALALEFGDARRELVLLRGGAMFDVVPDASRAFVVHAGATSATAVGTRYAVTRVQRDVLVQVEEGKVAVGGADADAAPLAVEAGRQVRSLAGKVPAQTSPLDAGALEWRRSLAGKVPAQTSPLDAGALEWRRGLLVFEDTPLAEAVARLDAYIPGRVLLVGTSQVRVSAAIALADAPAALAAIAAREGLAVEAIPGVVMVVH